VQIRPRRATVPATGTPFDRWPTLASWHHQAVLAVRFMLRYGLAGRGLLWLAGPGRLGVCFALAGRGLLWLAGPGRLGVRFAHGHFSFRFITGAT
jgi:hypothetical protein